MKRYISVLIIFVMIFLCIGCYDGYALREKYPYYKSDYWYCEEIDFAFFYEYDETGLMKQVKCPMRKDGQTLNVIVDFIIDSWYIDLDNGDGSTSTEEQLMSGTWVYRGNDLVLIIEQDNLYDGKFQELVFVAEK